MFTNNGYDSSSSTTAVMSQLLYLNILEGYTFNFISCTFTSNSLSNTPVLVTDQSSLSSSTTPTAVNFLIQNCKFVSNTATDNAGALKIMNNAWLYVSVTGTEFNGNIYENHYIGNIYK